MGWTKRLLLPVAILTLAAACGSSIAVDTHAPLGELGKAKDKLVGTAFRSTFSEGDDRYQQVALQDFASLTTEIGTMTNTVAPERGRYDFGEADAVCNLAKSHDKDCQIHSLIWDPLDQPGWKIVPDWITSQPAPERHETMVDLVTGVTKHFAGRSSMVTVVNEAFDQMGNLQHNTWWQTTQSDQYIVDAFRAARLADPKTELYYNDHSAETHSDKSNAIYALVKKLRDTTVDVQIDGKTERKPLIDGMGFQGHMLGGPNQQPSTQDMKDNLQRFADLGVDVRFTELDVRIPVEDGVAAPADLERQKQVYSTMTNLCVTQPKCSGVTVWGFTDKRSWITDYPDTFSGYGAANLYDVDYRPKPARDGVGQALVG